MGLLDELLCAGVGVVEGVGVEDDVADAVGAVGGWVGVVGGVEQVEEGLAGLGVGGGESVDEWECKFAFVQVTAKGFADGVFGAGDVEYVVDDLVGESEFFAVGVEGVDGLCGCVVDHCAEFAAGAAKAGGFEADNLEVGVFVEVEVCAVVELEELALADGVGGVGECSAASGLVEAGAEVVCVADEVVAEHDGGFVAAEVVDGCAASSDVCVVEDVVVDEGGHVDHFGDGCDDAVWVGEAAGGG